MPRRVHHLGPDPAFPGGMGSVIRVMAEHRLGCAATEVVPTWRPSARAWGAAPALAAARRVVAAPRREVVHIHLAEDGAFVREGGLAMLARIRGHPTVATIHGSRFLGFASRHRELARRVLAAAHAITCLSEEVRELASQLAPRALVELVPNPVALDASAPGADQTEELVLFAGEIGERKGVDVLCAAWPALAASRPSARCLLVGPLAGQAPAPTERLEVRAPVGPEGIRQLLRCARVVALPSRAEGMPMILTEAMAARRPFVSTPVGGIPSLAPGGVLVPVGDAAALAQALEGLLADPGAAKALGERGLAHCRETRALDVVSARLDAVYDAAEKRARRCAPRT